MVSVKEDLTGWVFGRLTVIKQAEDYVWKGKKHYTQWLCKCSCGSCKEVIVRGCNLKSGQTTSCGCVYIENIRETGKNNKKYNQYNLSGEFGIGFTSNTNNEFYFDLEDYDIIKDYCWYEKIDDDGYRSLNALNIDTYKIVKFHTALGYNNLIDHKDHNPLNNKRDNLRNASYQENARNHSLRKDNTTGFTGVRWDKQKNKWGAFISVNKKDKCLGYFIDKDEAIRTRLIAEKELFGDYAPQRNLFNQYRIKE